MTDTASKKYKFNTATGRTGAKKYEDGEAPPPSPKGRVPRISKMMALAIRFEKFIQDGIVENQAEIAQLGMISRARVTQIMNLLNLAPEIQEELLFLPRVESGKDTIHLKGMLPVAAEVDWTRQREISTDLTSVNNCHESSLGAL